MQLILYLIDICIDTYTMIDLFIIYDTSNINMNYNELHSTYNSYIIL